MVFLIVAWFGSAALCAPVQGIGYLFFETGDTGASSGVMGLGICQSILNNLIARNDVYVVDTESEQKLRGTSGIFDSSLGLNSAGMKTIGTLLEADRALVCVASPSMDPNKVGFRVLFLYKSNSIWKQQGAYSFSGKAAEYARLIKLALDQTLKTLKISAKGKPSWPVGGGPVPSLTTYKSYSRALRAYLLERTDEALALSEIALGGVDKFRDLHILMGTVYLKRKFDFDRAKYHLAKALELFNDARNRQRLGMVYYLYSSGALAREQFEKAAELNPFDPQSFFNLSLVLDDMGNDSGVIDALKKVVELTPNNGAAWYNLACKYALGGKKQEAVKALSNAVKVDRELFTRMAQTDQDLNNIRYEPEFQKIISGE